MLAPYLSHPLSVAYLLRDFEVRFIVSMPVQRQMWPSFRIIRKIRPLLNFVKANEANKKTSFSKFSACLKFWALK
jgi:hypothetical protein